MVKPSGSDHTSLRKGAWSAEEDHTLINYVNRYGIWNWTEMPKYAGLLRSGKSCRLRWLNYLKPNIKRGNFSQEEDQILIKLHEELGNRWCKIAARLPGRTDNEIKNRWYTHLKKRLKNNSLPSSSLERRENGTVEANHNDLPKIDLLLPKSPKPLNLDGCNSLPSPYTDVEIYQNQPIEANKYTNEELQRLSESFYVDDHHGVIFANPEFEVLSSQLELQEYTFTYYDGGFDLWA